MSAVDSGRDSLAAVAPPGNQINRTLLEIIRDEDPCDGSDGLRKNWKVFRDKLRLKRAGATWTSSVHITASDIRNNNNNQHVRSPFSRRNSLRFTTMPSVPPDSNELSEDVNVNAIGDATPARSFKPQISRHNSTRFPASNSDSNQPGENEYEPANEGTRRLAAALAEERQLSAREAVAAQEASEAAAAAAAEGTDSEGEAEEQSGAGQPVRMSLMDLLEENDRQLGLEGSTHMMVYDEEELDDDDYYEDVEQFGGGGVEYNCRVCMVRHKGAAFIPCGHTFCRLCSRELWVRRGDCPICNGFILEILDIF
ncbi:uncharacterized protein LOC119991271 [Tripterygium wilfordii]|uniref:uncharacterized protein LOC119991271 n=1 Tax=Tripterygium wilfordii TaxID=458696 RepID=UPI0018F8448F|nr:uncharacterized protein LOC119991271 [Tripterygium wilfordii]XP_038693514.1 uncharacterized protein LOC119991271 [Tripterygium wilfordii]XP_038693515.1 uncharacterized protein LOC119991271 [Tripterygium wilfordii]XP_038693516.1 uncharacterized protein LOC119991271 [Tripterygium wilfordii]